MRIKMKITFPHMGNLYIILAAFFENLGIDFIVPPPITKKTIELGAMYSPEFACFPLKINVGNFIEALEMGADTILMAGGIGPCRFGYYAQVEKEILTDLGYKCNMVVLEPPKGNLKEVLFQIYKLLQGKDLNNIIKAAKIAWMKAKALEEIEKEVFFYRAREKVKGMTTKLYRKALRIIHETKEIDSIKSSIERINKEFKRIELKKDHDPLRIGLVGEIYTLLEPSSNMNIEETLGELGAEVEKSIRLTEWTNTNLILDMLRIKGELKCRTAAKPYLNYFVGGHGLESVGETVLYANSGVDGVIHLAPFTCMPEIVAQSILPRVSKEKNIPVITMMLDEHSAEAGFRTRIEAFVDLLEKKREEKLYDEQKLLSWD
jgi:predicted nucleotide-binding protein (sugar kinase/HSP70/actin superfamily)